jgi:hypothetical protein
LGRGSKECLGFAPGIFTFADGNVGSNHHGAQRKESGSRLTRRHSSILPNGKVVGTYCASRLERTSRWYRLGRKPLAMPSDTLQCRSVRLDALQGGNGWSAIHRTMPANALQCALMRSKVLTIGPQITSLCPPMRFSALKGGNDWSANTALMPSDAFQCA